MSLALHGFQLYNTEMNTFVILFIVSIIGMILMMSLRAFELMTNRNIISENFRDMTDRKIIILWNKVSRYLNVKKKKFNIFLEHIPVFFARLLYIILKWGRKKGDRFFNMVKGKGALTNRGSASFFLNSIHEHKQSEKK